MNCKNQSWAKCSTLLLLLFSFLFLSNVAAMGQKLPPLTIVYTNDTHCYVNNEAIRFSNIAQYVQNLRAEGKNVFLVDAGDFTQGSAYGKLDKGAIAIELMNAAGYDVAALGNHDLDYGPEILKRNLSNAKFKTLSCNLRNQTGCDGFPIEPYAVVKKEGVAVGFIGITTPDVLNLVNPLLFKNSDNEDLYYFAGSKAPKELYETVQQAIDKVKEQGADYVVALGHLGLDNTTPKKKIDSADVIANVSGLNVWIDGHTHMKGSQYVIDKDGANVFLTQSGYYLNAFGVLEVDEKDVITYQFIENTPERNEEVVAIENAFLETADIFLRTPIATLDSCTLTTNDPKTNKRIVRSQETNLGDLIADSFYWFYNEKTEEGCDVAIMNGGSIRTSIEPGVITYKDLFNVFPFESSVVLKTIPGSELLNALEYGAKEAEQDQFGGFLQVAGMKYEIDLGVASTITSEPNQFRVAGRYRVQNVQIYDKERGVYEQLKLDKTYRVASTNFILQGGDGFRFPSGKVVNDQVLQVFNVVKEYLESFTDKKAQTSNCPLNRSPNYLLDYENPFGSKRIILKNASANLH